ncbi:TIGR02221 family CRISPR-associated protein [Desulfallas thermosapovorans]|uniref:CRISPR-associated Csx2 family protein n=1 Tax=Desulfallas thermosapovorans DSM 6562 TaxID=1121431 RepID=A0A5S4ZMN6_9FIRM|nr:TIGR02221 family CRISPR-associated protein [Desulfallas thermosapovorans]TYO92766.1 CRISPR-associated Csx2 family protein [Desulfallas thermosapovorans DSM 6562]
MKKTLITFIGTGNYSETTYQNSAISVKTKYFPVAAALLASPERILVVQTTQAREKHWQSLRGELLGQGLPEPGELAIPGGETTAELWEIFRRIVASVGKEEEVVFDITHAFRTIPLISFLSVAYLKFVRGIEITGLYYGAYEARDEKNISPIFDLTGFCELLDWIVGVNAFISYGAAQKLGGLLKRAQKVKSLAGDKGRSELNRFGELITQISNALLTVRPFEVLETTAKLERYQAGTESRRQLEHDIKNWAPPFGMLLDELLNDYLPFAGNKDHTRETNLSRQLEMVRWYVKRQYIPQALTLMRELAISEQMRREGRLAEGLNVNLREEMARKFHSAIKSKTPLGNLWSRLPGLRNDVDHAGWRDSSRSARTILEDTAGCLGFLEEYFRQPSFPNNPGARREEDVPVKRAAGEKKVLISPLGMSPGLLYTAVRRIAPDFLLVLTSKEAVASLEEILARAGYTGRCEVITVADPHTGFDRVPEVLARIEQSLPDPSGCRLYINLTGGTTCLQHIISRAGGVLASGGAAVTTVAMIDRRPASEQREEPCVLGEMIVVDGDGKGENAGGA